MPEETFTLEQVAKRLQVSERTILRLLESKELTGFKVGRSWRFTQGDLDTFIQRQRKEAEREAPEEAIA